VQPGVDGLADAGTTHPVTIRQGTAVEGFAELTLEARDPGALAAFYTRCFGLTELSREEDRIWLSAGEHARLGLWRPGRKEFGDEGGAHVHFAFTVPPGGLDDLVERLRGCDLEVEGPHEHDGGDRSIYVRDPEGNVVEAWDHFERGRTVENLSDD
jgi:catechol-2,3-dioxygenase